MTIVNVHALAQTEPVIEKVYREVFMKKGDCRFKLEVLFSDKQTCDINLQSVSKISAKQEAGHLVENMMEIYDDERIIWRISGESVWSIASAEAFKKGFQKKKKESLWSKIIDTFFLTEDEIY